MSKYLPLAEYLSRLKQNEVCLSFSEIERIIGCEQTGSEPILNPKINKREMTQFIW